jgi:hypothetical protein
VDPNRHRPDPNPSLPTPRRAPRCLPRVR